MTSIRSKTSARSFAWLPAVLAALLCHSSAHAASPLAAFSWNDYWLNTDYARHGKSVDQIFYFIFWLTTIIMVIVEIVLVWFMFKYRHRDGSTRKAIYSHGNTRLEMIWTIIPAIILIVVALWTKRVWDDYRYSPTANDPNRLQVLVIGEQYKWNVIYPGPNGKIGRFLIYPKTTDLKWPIVPPGKDFRFPNVPGPAYLPEQQANIVLTKYISEINPLGRDYSDPDTDPLPPADRARFAELATRTDRNAEEQKEFEELSKIESLNDYSNANSRPIVIPKDRPVEFMIGSRDVIHDFFLPNFRERLDAVPGMKGKLYMTATTTCKSMQAPTRAYTLDELDDLVVKQKKSFVAVVNENSPGAEHKTDRRHHLDFWRYATKDGETIIRDGYPVTAETIKDLRAAGVEKITAFCPFYWELVCEELCGVGHKDMAGKLIVVDEADLLQGDYKNYFPEKKTVASAQKP